ncbi:MAG: BrnT family toxin [Alphaproteobacteria bacterium]
MDFEWDEAKRLVNLEKHGLDFRDAPSVFRRPCLFAPAPYGSERRWVLVGRLGARY